MAFKAQRGNSSLSCLRDLKYGLKIILPLLVAGGLIAAGCTGSKQARTTVHEQKGSTIKISIPLRAENRPKSSVSSAPQQSIAPELYEAAGNRVFKEKNGTYEYLVGEGDVLSVTAWKGTVPNTTEVIVRPYGMISYSFLDDLQVEGLTVSEIDTLITEELKQYVKKPRLDMVVKEYNNKKVVLSGEIVHRSGQALTGPNIYPLRGRTTLLDLILLAGGQTDEADLSKVELIRRGKSYKINLIKSLLDKEENREIIIDDGDRVMVPKFSEGQEKKVLVLGEVSKPGILTFKGEITFTDVIAKAGGTTLKAVLDDIRIIRGDHNNYELIKVDLKRILNEGNLSQNYTLNNKDIVYVPKKRLHKFKEWVDVMLPIFDFFLQPAFFRDSYTTGSKFIFR